LDQSSPFSRTYGGLTKWEEIKSTVKKLSSKRGGKSEAEGITLDVLVAGSMSPDIFETGSYRDFRNDWGEIGFDYNTLNKRLNRKIEFENGDLGALVDFNKWDGSGNYWDEEAITLFRNFYYLPSPAVYLDHTGRKVNFTNFEGEKEYDFLFGINPKSKINFIKCFKDLLVHVFYEGRWI